MRVSDESVERLKVWLKAWTYEQPPTTTIATVTLLGLIADRQDDHKRIAELEAEVKQLRLVVAECLDQYPRFVQLYEEHPMGTAEYRLGEAMLDALDKFRKAKTAEAAEGVSDAD